MTDPAIDPTATGQGARKPEREPSAVTDRTAETPPGTSEPDPRSPLSVRRAILPWRRRIRNISDFDFTPGGFDSYGHDPISGFIFVFLFPLWLPALVVLLIAAIEFVLALPFVPFALLRRRRRRAWPVELLDRRGRLLERTNHRSWRAAGKHSAAIREKDDLGRWV